MFWMRISLNISAYEHQRLLLDGWGIRVRQIGREIGRIGMHDDGIITLLHGQRRVTFFTRDRDFADPHLCHPMYCLVRLICEPAESAEFVRRVLRLPELRTQKRRMGSIVRASHAGLRIWRRDLIEQQLPWPER
jgi:hypothetical protein